MHRILLADDEPFILEGINHLIHWEEYGIEKVVTASNGIEAFEVIEKEGTDILITDIKMPKMNGLELIRKTKEKGFETKFIVLSGFDDFEYLKESIKLGIENYLLKPINYEELVSTLANTISKLNKDNYKKQDFKRDSNIIKENILLRWVTNSISSEELTERASFLGIRLESKAYRAVIIKLLFDKQLNFEQKSRLIASACEICSGFSEENAQGSILCGVDDDIILIFTGDIYSLKSSLIKENLLLCMEKLKQLLQLSTFITIGRLEEDFTFLYRSFDTAKEIQQYSIILPPDNILEYEEVKESAVQIRSNELIDFEKLNKLIASKNKHELENYIDNIFKKLPNFKGMNPAVLQNIAVEMLFSVLNTVRTTKYWKDDLFCSFEYSFSDVYRMTCVKDMAQWIKEACEKVVDLFTSGAQGINPVVKRILENIHSNYMGEASLKTLAAQYHVNPNYLGQLFKEETGEFFSDYVNKMRIKNAKELLKNTSLSTRDISLQVGMEDPNYFYKIFKKYTGISPTDYRNL